MNSEIVPHHRRHGPSEGMFFFNNHYRSWS